MAVSENLKRVQKHKKILVFLIIITLNAWVQDDKNSWILTATRTLCF